MNNFTDNFSEIEIPNLDLIRLPEINLTKDELSLVESVENNTQFFKKLVTKGWIDYRDKVPKEKWSEYINRTREEVALIEELGFIDYILLVWRMINEARKLGAFIDYGRGSVGNSITCFFLGIHGVDSVDKKLIFARFLSKIRSKKSIINGVEFIQGSLAPDIDVNFGGVRNQIVDILRNLYPGRVAKIATFSTLSGKIAIKECLKVIEEANEEDAQYAANLIDKNFGIVQDIDEALEKNEKFQIWAKDHQKTVKICKSILSLIKGVSTHASGYAISYDPLDDCCPTQLNKEGDLMVSYEKDTTSELMIKADLLGLTACSQIKDVLDNIPENVEDFELDVNPEIYTHFQDGKLLPYGLYQISADCALNVVNKVKPANIHELSDVNALARPGALAYVDAYCKGAEECPHPMFEEILKPTRNLCLYQEQLLRCLIALGFTPEESETCRKIVGKKQVEKVKEWKEKIYNKCKANGYEEKIGDILWKILEDSAFYSFNAGHSYAVSYLGALTVLLKYKYPLEFYKSCLKFSTEYPDPMGEISAIQKELVNFNIKLLPPHLIKSKESFSIENGNIRYGLGNLKGVAGASIEKLIKFRGEYKEKHLGDNKFRTFLAAKDSKLNLGVVCALIQCGALEDFCENRPRGVLEYQLFNLLTDKEKRLVSEFIENNNEEGDIINIVKELNSKKLIKDSRMETIRKKSANYLEMYKENTKNQELYNYFAEKTLIGYSFTTSLVNIFKKKNPNFSDIKNFKNSSLLVAHVVEVKKNKSKKGNVYLKFVLEDSSSTITGLLFESKFLENEGCDQIEEDDVVTIKGKLTEDGKSIFIDTIRRQDCKIMTKSRDLK